MGMLTVFELKDIVLSEQQGRIYNKNATRSYVQ